MNMKSMPFRIISLTALLFLLSMQLSFSQGSTRYHYALRVYQFSDSTQRQAMSEYLRQAFVPALHRAGIPQVGVFVPHARQVDSAVKPGLILYVLIPLKNTSTTEPIDSLLLRDREYIAAAKTYTDAAFDHPAYARMETILLLAFSGHPAPAKPSLTGSADQRVYELRSYHSATESLAVKKIRMFNDGGEIRLFNRLGFNAVFYGQVIAGAAMPNLMYMTSFNNREARDQHWGSFGADPEWKKISGLPEYKNNVSHIDIWLLAPTTYSDL